MEEEFQLENAIQLQDEVDKDAVVGDSGDDIDTNNVNKNAGLWSKKINDKK